MPRIESGTDAQSLLNATCWTSIRRVVKRLAIVVTGDEVWVPGTLGTSGIKKKKKKSHKIQIRAQRGTGGLANSEMQLASQAKHHSSGLCL